MLLPVVRLRAAGLFGGICLGVEQTSRKLRHGCKMIQAPGPCFLSLGWEDVHVPTF